MISLDCTLLRERDSKRERVAKERFFGVFLGYSGVPLTSQWGLMSPLAPTWHSSAYKTWKKKTDREKLQIRVGKKTRGAHRLDKAIKTFGLYSKDLTTYERDNQRIKHSNEKWELQRLQPLSTLISVFWLSYSQRGGGRQRETQSHISETSGVGVIVYCAWLALTGRASCKSQQVGVQSLDRYSSPLELTASHHTPGGKQVYVCVCARAHMCIYTNISQFQQQGRSNEKRQRFHCSYLKYCRQLLPWLNLYWIICLVCLLAVLMQNWSSQLKAALFLPCSANRLAVLICCCDFFQDWTFRYHTA